MRSSHPGNPNHWAQKPTGRHHGAAMNQATALEKAQAIASTAGMFFVASGSTFDLFRRMPDRRVWIGRRASPEGLHQLVRRCARVS